MFRPWNSQTWIWTRIPSFLEGEYQRIFVVQQEISETHITACLRKIGVANDLAWLDQETWLVVFCIPGDPWVHNESCL